MLNAKKGKTAILVFAQSAEEEIRHKPISKGEAFFEQLNDHILNQVKKTGLPYFHVSEEHQIGESFGARFVNAIEFVFNKGYESIITIGNDSPQLRTKQLLAAHMALTKGNNVLGPSKDGGFYLLGIHKTHFEKNDFINLPWQKRILLDHIQYYFDALESPIVKMEYLRDIDTLHDAKILLEQAFLSISRKIHRLLNNLFDRPEIKILPVTVPIKINNYRAHDLVRGSP